MPESPSFAVSASDDTLLRGRLLWLVAAPAGAAALLFAVTAGYLWAGGADRSDLVLIIAFLVGVVALTATAGQAVGTIRRLDDRPAPLRAELAEAQAQTAAARAGLADARAEATAALTEAAGYRAAVTDARAEIETLSERVRLAEERPVPVRTSAGRQVEVFVNLSRRLQSLVHREIKLLDALENEVEDPDLLKGLFQVDHLATRIRRHAENLAVLGGAVSRRQWSRPVALTEVLRSAIAEVEHYSRVKLVPPIDGTVPGHAVASIIHLVAELIENATMFAPPQTQVLLRAQHVTAGVVVEVEDRGLGMQREDQERVNRLLLNPEDINLDELLQDGRIGLFVVSMIARQHGVTVQLQGNIYGGTQAVIVLPKHLLGSAQDYPEPAAAQPALTQTTMELAQRVPGPSQIAAPPPSWPAFASELTAPALVSATSVPTSAMPIAAAPVSAALGSAVPSQVSASPASGQPASMQAVSAHPVSGHPASEQPASSHSTSGHLASAQPASSQSTSGHLASAQAASSHSASNQPASGHLASSHSVSTSGHLASASAASAHTAPPAPVASRPEFAAPGSAASRPTNLGGAPPLNPAPMPIDAPRRTAAEAAEGRPAVTPPPLPRRHSQTHLAPQLQFGPPPSAPGDDEGEHDPGLMASFMQGVSRSEAGSPTEPSLSEPAQVSAPPSQAAPSSFESWPTEPGSSQPAQTSAPPSPAAPSSFESWPAEPSSPQPAQASAQTSAPPSPAASSPFESWPTEPSSSQPAQASAPPSSTPLGPLQPSLAHPSPTQTTRAPAQPAPPDQH